jgi:hypothetical protein
MLNYMRGYVASNDEITQDTIILKRSREAVVAYSTGPYHAALLFKVWRV